MRHAALILILLASLTSAQDAANGNSYLCIPDRSVGFAFDKASKIWEPATFEIEARKYIVRRFKEDDLRYKPGREYGVWEFGKENSLATCDRWSGSSWWLQCDRGVIQSFLLNVKTNRFMYIFRGSYMNATYGTVNDKDGFPIEDENGNVTYRHKEDEGGDTPLMEIGNCSKL